MGLLYVLYTRANVTAPLISLVFLTETNRWDATIKAESLRLSVCYDLARALSLTLHLA